MEFDIRRIETYKKNRTVSIGYFGSRRNIIGCRINIFS